jgi:S-DNA-T family DNA segregation ATPase FtsK/SpoIIIE
MQQQLTPEQVRNLTAFALKFDGLGIKATFSRIEVGPVVTTYYFSLAHSVPLRRVLNKSEDFALATGAEKVTIARIGNEIAVFVPNKERKIVDFKEVLHWIATDTQARKLRLPLCIGVDTLGNKAALDLTELPHVLMAGQTGSGKSVLEAAMIATLAVVKTPQELKMYLVDTKKLDLPLFRDLPHVREVVTDVEEFHAVFYKLLKEIRSRMEALSQAGVRNITEYHTLIRDTTTMPYIVVVIDELADLIDQDNSKRKEAKGDEEGAGYDHPTIKGWLKQVAQIARAAGIHVIACTQRTSAKIVDGDIKVNLPCRIALRMPTRFDSVTILGDDGAETLLGNGDMLVQNPLSETVKRYHGPFVSMSDITGILIAQESLRESFKAMAVSQ